MRMTTRYAALGLAGLLLAACHHQDKDAPLAFAPADTPYVVANLEPLDDDTREALFARANAQLPAQLAQFEAMASRMEQSDPASARLLRALHAELQGKDAEAFARGAGVDTSGHAALYGVGLAPVLRLGLSDPSAFEAFVGRLEKAWGEPLETATVDGQNYRRHVFTSAGTQVILATVGKQAVAALLPADAAQPLLRQALGLDRPQKSLQDDGRLATLAKAKGYRKWGIGQLDLTRALPLAIDGKDPLFAAIRRSRAEAESAKTGEPVANQLRTSPGCAADAVRLAARVPSLSFGYTRLDATHQDMRMDVALAPDISQAFAGLQVALPGLGNDDGGAPFDLSIALPVADLRAFWGKQAEAVVAKPFTCESLLDLNDSFAKLGPMMQQAAIPPFGDMLGLRLALDTLSPTPDSSLPDFSGRLVLATKNPDVMLAMSQMMVSSLSQLKPAADGTPTPLPQDMVGMLGQPAWIARADQALALGIGKHEDKQLAATLKDPTGQAGQMVRLHLDGAMYLAWLKLMETRIGDLASATAAISQDPDAPAADAHAADSDASRAQAQFAAMKAQAERIRRIDVEMHVEQGGMVINNRTELDPAQG